jgi:hypothetical protein
MTHLYVDMDGVLADFDRHHEAAFGLPASKLTDDVDWAAVRGVKDFYLHIPPMPDMLELWDFIEPHKPIILTGVPKSVPEAAENKRAWVVKNLGPQPMICCPSKEKSKFCNIGDVLIDDWDKYKHLWLAAGGRWVTHTNAADTIKQLSHMDLGDPFAGLKA